MKEFNLNILKMDSEILFPYTNIGLVRATKPSLSLFQPPIRLSLDDKVYMASLILNGKLSIVKLAECTKLSARSLRRWAKTIKNGKFLRLCEGRPSCLDPTGWSRLVEWMRANPGTDNGIINAEIRQEYKNSCERRCQVNPSDNHVPPKMKRQTVHKARLKLLALSGV